MRPNRQVLFIAATLLALASLAIVLISAVSDKHAFDAERRGAVEARRDVEQLLATVLEQLHGELDRDGQLHLLEKTARQSLDYYLRRNEGREGCVGWRGCDDREVLGEARAVTRSGLVLRSLGDLDGALAAFELNRFRLRGLIAIEVRPSWQLELSRAHRLIAEVHAARGEAAEALVNARSAAALSGALSPDAPLTGPAPPGWADIHRENLLRLGQAQSEVGDVDTARATLEAARELAAEPAEHAEGRSP